MNRLLLLSLTILFFSCHSEMENSVSNNNEGQIPSKEIKFTYKGVTYHSTCEVIDDVLFIIDDEIREVYDQIQLLPKLATLYLPNGDIEYFDCYADLKDAYNFEEFADIPTKATASSYTLELYENTNYKKLMESFTTSGTREVAVMAKRDKLSSFKLIVNKVPGESNLAPIMNAYLTLFDYYDFGEPSKTFLVLVAGYTGNTPKLEVSNLKDWGWNDKAASYKSGFQRKTIP